jgi:hypothetical protein
VVIYIKQASLFDNKGGNMETKVDDCFIEFLKLYTDLHFIAGINRLKSMVENDCMCSDKEVTTETPELDKAIARHVNVIRGSAPICAGCRFKAAGFEDPKRVLIVMKSVIHPLQLYLLAKGAPPNIVSPESIKPEPELQAAIICPTLECGSGWTGVKMFSQQGG